MTVEAADEREFTKAERFTVLGTPLLSEGYTQTLLGLASNLWVQIKVHGNNGGERELHSHKNEDHAFFILSGRAVFRNVEDESSELGPYEGIMIPRGVRYSFESLSDEPLVMLRMGASDITATRSSGRPSATKSDVPQRQHHVEIPGRVFTGTH